MSKESIADATIALSYELGMQGASTAKIAERAGIATGTLFHHFATKQDLLNYTYLYIQQKMKSAIADKMGDPSIKLEEKGRLHLVNSVDYWVRHRAEFEFTRQFFHSAQFTPELLAEFKSQCTEKRAMLEKEMEEGRIRTMDIDLFMHLIESTVLAIAAQVLSTNDTKQQQAYLEEGFLFMWNAVKA